MDLMDDMDDVEQKHFFVHIVHNDFRNVALD